MVELQKHSVHSRSYSGVTGWWVFSLANNLWLNANTSCTEDINQRTSKHFISAVTELTLISYSWSNVPRVMSVTWTSDNRIKMRSLLPTCFAFLFANKKIVRRDKRFHKRLVFFWSLMNLGILPYPKWNRLSEPIPRQYCSALKLWKAQITTNVLPPQSLVLKCT